jgi:hypothetical protein
MGTETVEAGPSADELRSGKAAFEQLLPIYRELPAEKVVVPRVDVRRAALVALSVARAVNEPARRALFAKLPAELFDIALLDYLELSARAAMFARVELATAEALASEAKLPAGLGREAMELRKRMLKVIDYHLGDNEEIGRLVTDIRSGSGYFDLAEDLWRLSELYRTNHALISKDPSFYSADDADVAERTAKKIQDELGNGSTPRQKELRDTLARAWTLLSETYERVARPGRWIFHDDDGAALFVSLGSASRRPPRAKERAEANPVQAPAA